MVRHILKIASVSNHPLLFSGDRNTIDMVPDQFHPRKVFCEVFEKSAPCTCQNLDSGLLDQKVLSHINAFGIFSHDPASLTIYCKSSQ